MPEMDGLVLGRVMQADPDLSLIPIIMISAYDTAQYKQQAAVAGYNSFLVKQLGLFQGRVEAAASRREPHLVVNYMRDLANQFHSWYNAHHFIVDDSELRDARLALASATGQVLRNGLKMMGVSAPEKM